MSHIKLIHGDCRSVMRGLPARSIDVCITDPPYGETSLDWDERVDGWLDAVRRVLKPSGSLWCFGSMRFFLERVADFADWKLAQEVVWEKHNGSGFLNDRFRRVHELAVQFYPADRAWAEIYREPQFTNDATARTIRHKKRPAQWSGERNGGYVYRSEDGGPRLVRSVIFARSEHGRAIHPTQKPLDILDLLIRYSCPEGGAVLDCFAGSGSTGIAARAAKRDAVLIEQNAKFYDAAHAWLKEPSLLEPAEVA